ncbi:sigma-54 interaction domain-containing protein [Edaphobacillus lindanitolerans]|uniref:PAS domain S-box-containing protein n=1 Tax=Edaphobacillus lindanitolerans TaxID=550447 RepID=A0A1U7PIE6_9BACI|nr:sigma 54-interacting transcriptional regulator [Edaphobacillus lindanitolerans]SIT73346.1 PAS domain S-box-containing protein [Edaphobacillus lindanitolerans]
MLDPTPTRYSFYLQALLDTSNDAISIINSDGVVEFWNEHAENLYGIPSGSILGKKMNTFFKKEDLKILEILKTQEYVFNIYHQPRPDKHIMISASPIFNETGGLLGALSIDQDISNIVELNDKLTLTTSELQKIKHQYNEQNLHDPLSTIKGNSPALQTVKSLAMRVAKTDATVLIQGESGVGKELFAKGIHEASPRKDKPFIAVNCGAIPEALFESEFFGYEKGSFTGADKNGKAGKVEMATSGTLFLDEIGTLPLDMQVKLLRVLQEREVYRIGGHSPIKVDIRIVAATNSDLEEMVRLGQFREDLYYRLNVVTLDIPPLRRRADDIPALMESFIQEFSYHYDKEPPDFTEAAMAACCQYDWPGNIRELRNLVERLVILIDSPTVKLSDLQLIMPHFAAETKRPTLSLEKDQLEKNRITEALQETYGNKTAAAKKLGISRVSLYKKIKQYGIEC